MPTVAFGAAALITNRAMVSTMTIMRPVLPDKMLASCARCFIMVLLIYLVCYFPIPTVALGAAALMTNRAMVSTIRMMRPVLPDKMLASFVRFFIFISPF